MADRHCHLKRDEAQEICKESWLRNDLILPRSDEAPVCTSQSKLSVRLATDEEAVIYEQAVEVSQPSDDMVLVYLIELDA
jgi:hypothetical protein